ncbi:hypothetical protein Tco_0589082 [Tanacetum coccineum]
MASVIKNDFMMLPYAMLLTRLYRHVLTIQPFPTTNVHYLVDHVMVPITEGKTHRLIIDGKRPHPQTSSGSSSSPYPTSNQDQIDLVDNYTLDPVVYLIMEYLVNISKRRAFWSLNEDILKIYYSDNQYADILIRASRLKKVMANKGKKSSMETFTPNDKAYYYSGITSITVNGKNAYELKGKFLDDLHNNAFSGTNGKDAVEHIECYLKIIDPIKLPNVDHDKLRVVVFPISLAGGDLWDYWKIGGDEIEVSDDETFDLKEYWSDKEEETTKIFKIETDIFDYETPLCLAFNEFNYLLKVDPYLLTKDIMRFKTYEDYKNDWIYEWNQECTMEWLTYSWREDGYCNGGNLPGPYHIGNWLHYQDHEWYKALEDSELKDEALRNKAIMEGLISDDESSNDYWKRWKSHEIYYHNYNEGEYENETHKEGHELCGPRERNIDEYWWRTYKSRDLEVLES